MPYLLLLLSIFWASSCTLGSEMLMRPHPDLEGPQIFLSERDWGWLRESVTTDLAKMEKELLKKSDQHPLRANVIRSYSLLASLVFESLSLEEKLLKDKKYFFERSLKLHQKAVEHGRIYLKNKNLELSTLGQEDLQIKIASDEMLPLLYIGKSLAALSFEEGKNSLEAKVIFDWICPQQPKIEEGVCPLFYAQFEIKNNPQTSLMIYRRFIKENPYHLLARMNFIEYALIEMQLKEELDSEFYDLEDGIRKWQEGAGPKELNLYNATAKVRFRIIQRYKNKIFN